MDQYNLLYLDYKIRNTLIYLDIVQQAMALTNLLGCCNSFIKNEIKHERCGLSNS